MRVWSGRSTGPGEVKPVHAGVQLTHPRQPQGLRGSLSSADFRIGVGERGLGRRHPRMVAMRGSCKRTAPAAQVLTV